MYRLIVVSVTLSDLSIYYHNTAFHYGLYEIMLEVQGIGEIVLVYMLGGG